MKLLNDLYRIIDSSLEGSELEVRVRLNPSHPIFKSHFPGYPVTPGVIQLKIVQELVEVFIESNINLRSIISGKFLSVVDPTVDSVITFRINHQIENTSSLLVGVVAESRERKVLNFNIRYVTKSVDV